MEGEKKVIIRGHKQCEGTKEVCLTLFETNSSRFLQRFKYYNCPASVSVCLCLCAGNVSRSFPSVCRWSFD